MPSHRLLPLALALLLLLTAFPSSDARPPSAIPCPRPAAPVLRSDKDEDARKAREKAEKEAAKQAEKRRKEREKAIKEARKDAEKAAKKAAKKAAEEAKRNPQDCGPILLAYNEVANDLDDVRTNLRACDARNANFAARENALAARSAALDRTQSDLTKRQARLDAREAALPVCNPPPPLPARSPTPTPAAPHRTPSPPPDNAPPAAVCEACGSCAPTLDCVAGVCQREDRAQPRCRPAETCDVGDTRVCRPLKPADFATPGELTADLARQGFFVGTTEMIAGCVNGKVRFDCKRQTTVCAGDAFCLEQTREECEAEGLDEVTEDVPIGLVLTRQLLFRQPGVRQLGNSENSCCTLVVQRNCFEDQLCQCKSRNGRRR